MQNKFKLIFTFIFLFLTSSCSGKNEDNFDFSDFKVPVKESISNESKPIEKKNLNTIQYELRPFRNREEILSSFKFEKKDPFKLDSQTSNKLSDIKLKGFLTISNKNYAVVNYLDNEGSINTESIGGENTNLLPNNAYVKNINPLNEELTIVIENEMYTIKLDDN